jgi:hypothetical protein
MAEAVIRTSWETMSQHLAEVSEVQAERIETLTAAFLSEVGSEKASEYELVQERTPTGYRWFFRKRVADEDPSR